MRCLGCNRLYKDTAGFSQIGGKRGYLRFCSDSDDAEHPGFCTLFCASVSGIHNVLLADLELSGLIVYLLSGSLSNDDWDGNENCQKKKKERKKENRNCEKKTFMHGHVSRFFVRAFFAATARLWRVLGSAYFHSNVIEVVKENMLTFD